MRNPGIHSRYIDGTVLEPGFELDELCAPLIAVSNYVKETGDQAILREPYIVKGVKKILALLETKRHPEIDLYETFLQPSDDVASHPYLTYDNALVWKALRDVGELFKEILEPEIVTEIRAKADSVNRAIRDHCVVEYHGRQIFAWSVDLKGNWRFYDEPPGSLQLLPFYGFCPAADPVYQNTVAEIRNPEYPLSFSNCPIAEIGCEHAPHPWILSVANSLLCGRKEESRDLLQRTSMDHGIACESVDEHTGECATGEAFATCAGFLAYALYYAFCRELTP
ncbi:MAG TPA: glycoside hydrolase family 125 protein, partial [Bacillota bacterium]|nr:glycoside hydrolase family 125 protein [Bacillota bacterium]